MRRENPAVYVVGMLRVITASVAASTHVKLPRSFRKLMGEFPWPPGPRSRFKSVFIVTYGRSGSSLLAGYLNRLPGFHIRGENHLFPVALLQSLNLVEAATRQASSARGLPTDPWYGAHLLKPRRLYRDVRRAILDQLYPYGPIPHTLGFKEIRWIDFASESDLFSALDAIQRLRPPAALIFLTRRHSDVLKSGWWANLNESERHAAKVRIEEFERRTQTYAAAHTSTSHFVRYEEFISGADEARSLCEFLGVEFDGRLHSAVLQIRHSYPSEIIPRSGSAENLRRYVRIKLGLVP